MTISKKRLFFRHFLLTILLFSVAFFALASYFFVTTRKNHDKLTKFIPVPHTLNILAYNIEAAFTSDLEAQYKIAEELYNISAQAHIYKGAAKDLLFPLVQKEYAPAQKLYADILRQERGSEDIKGVIIMNLYKRAAKQGDIGAKKTLEEYTKNK